MKAELSLNFIQYSKNSQQGRGHQGEGGKNWEHVVTVLRGQSCCSLRTPQSGHPVGLAVSTDAKFKMSVVLLIETLNEI